MELSEEISGRVTRSKLKRLGSVESDAPSRPATPLSKLRTISETDSPSRPVRSTRRNSVTATSGTPLKNPMSQLNKTADVSTPRKVGRPRKVELEVKDENDTPNRRVTRSQSISPPNSESVVKSRGKKISPKIENLPEVEEESDTNKLSNEESTTNTEEQENTSPKNRRASESSKSVCFNDSAIGDAEKTVYPKTPLHLKSIRETKENMNVSNYGSFTDLFNEDKSKSHMSNDSIVLDDEQAFNVSKSSERKPSKISSTPKVTQQVQIKIRKMNDDLFKKKSDTEEDTPTPVKNVDNSNEIVEISSNERSTAKSFSKSLIEDVEMKSPKTPNKANTSKQDDSAERSRNLLLDSIINEDGKVDCSQKRISLRYEKLQESLLLQEETAQSTDNSLKDMSVDDENNESRKSLNLSKLKSKSPAKMFGLNKSMPEQKSTEMAVKCKQSRYSTSNLGEAQVTTIPLSFENEDATEPVEVKTVEKISIKNKEKLSKSFNDISKEKKSNKKERHSMAEIKFSPVNENLPAVETPLSTEKLNSSKIKEAKSSDIEEDNEKMQQETEAEDDAEAVELNEKEDEEEEEEKTSKNTLAAWGTMTVHGTSQQKIDSIHFDDNKENNEVVDDESDNKSIDNSVKKRRRSRMQITESSDEDEDVEEADINDDEEEVELAKNEKPYKFNTFASEAAMDAEESYESGDSLESELEELMQENEIPTQAVDLGSEDTDVSESEEEEDDDSFIASDNEEELLDYDDYDEGINLEKGNHKRLFVFSSDSSNEENENMKDVAKKPVRNRSRCISSDDSEDEEKPLENEEKKESTEQENVPMIINAHDISVNNSRKSINHSQLETENDLIEVEENSEEQMDKLEEEENMDIEENNKHNASLNKSKISLKQQEMEVEMEMGDEATTQTETNIESPKKNEAQNEGEEMSKGDRKRKRMSQSFCESSVDVETVHKHKKTKLNEKPVKTAIVFEEDKSDFDRVQERCDDILEAANLAKLEAKLKAKQEKGHKVPKEIKAKSATDHNEDNCDVDAQLKSKELEESKTDPTIPHFKKVYSQLLKTASIKHSNDIAPFEEKIKSKQLSEDVLKAIAEKDAPVKQKKLVKKIKKHSAGVTAISANKLTTSAGEVRVIPSTPPPDTIETIETTTGIVRVEPVTPKLTQKAGVLRESPVTPFSIGMRVRKLMGEQDKLPECPNNKRNKKRKLVLEVDEPSNKLLQPQWTTSGVFKVENKSKETAKNVLIASNTMKHVFKSKAGDSVGTYLGATENALKFKMNAMSKASVPTESSSKILQRKKRQQVQQRF